MFDTVQGHLDNGRITARKRTRIDDLLFAATWLEAYEGDPDDDTDSLTALATVAAYLRRQAERRDRKDH